MQAGINKNMSERQDSYYALVAGLLGLCLGILMNQPKHISEAIKALLAGVFACLVIAPAIAELVTNFSISFVYFGWLNAAPGTALYAFIIGGCGILGFQIVVGLKEDVITSLRRWAKDKVNGNNGRSRSDNK
jgi:hypothetical protein